MGGQHLTWENRIAIESLLKAKVSASQIAAVDGCSAGIAWKASPKGDAQSAETFRVVGMDATDS